jgi:hypothetical protein
MKSDHERRYQTVLVAPRLEYLNLISGCALLLASVIAGTLWNTFGAPVTFLAGGAFALIAAVGLIAFYAYSLFETVGCK